MAAVIVVVATVWGATFYNSASSPPPLTLTVGVVRNDTGQRRYDPLARALTALVEDRVSKMPGVIVAEAGARSGRAEVDGRLEIRARLIIWNDTPTLSLAAVYPSDNRLAWSGMAVGQPDTIAGATIAQLAAFQRRVSR